MEGSAATSSGRWGEERKVREPRSGSGSRSASAIVGKRSPEQGREPVLSPAGCVRRHRPGPECPGCGDNQGEAAKAAAATDTSREEAQAERGEGIAVPRKECQPPASTRYRPGLARAAAPRRSPLPASLPLGIAGIRARYIRGRAAPPRSQDRPLRQPGGRSAPAWGLPSRRRRGAASRQRGLLLPAARGCLLPAPLSPSPGFRLAASGPPPPPPPLELRQWGPRPEGFVPPRRLLTTTSLLERSPLPRGPLQPSPLPAPSGSNVSKRLLHRSFGLFSCR